MKKGKDKSTCMHEHTQSHTNTYHKHKHTHRYIPDTYTDRYHTQTQIHTRHKHIQIRTTNTHTHTNTQFLIPASAPQQSNKVSMVCAILSGMMLTKYPLMLIGKSRPWSDDSSVSITGNNSMYHELTLYHRAASRSNMCCYFLFQPVLHDCCNNCRKWVKDSHSGVKLHNHSLTLV